MEPICLDILNEWAKYVEYDEHQTKSNLNGWGLDTHRATKSLQHITEKYDESGLLAVIRVKQLFLKMVNGSKITLMDAIANPKEIKRHKKMLDLFESKQIKQAQDIYADKIRQGTRRRARRGTDPGACRMDQGVRL